MRLPRHVIESQVPYPEVEAPDVDSLPQIRRQVERICEALGMDYNDLVELNIQPGTARVTFYKRNREGQLFRDQFGKLALDRKVFQVDTSTFIGDERDI